MNLNQLINMIARMITHRLTNWGINKGVGHLVRRNGPATPKSRQQTAETKASIRRTRQAANFLRRFMR